MMSPTKTPDEPAAKMPGETVRGLVSLWILFHLLAVVLAIATDSGMGTSQLLARIKRAPFLDQYMYALWFDVGYNYQLTYGSPLDADHTIETELVFPDGGRETKVFPPEGTRGERRERYRSLAQRTTSAADPEMGDSSMAGIIGGGLLHQTGAKEAIVRLRRHMPLSMENMDAAEAAQRDPFHPRTYSTPYTATVTLNRQLKPQVNTAPQSATDVAPVTRAESNQAAGDSTPAARSQPSGAARRTQSAPLPSPDAGKARPKSGWSLPPGIAPIEPQPPAGATEQK